MQHGPSRGVPQLDSLVHAAREQPTAVGRERDRVDVIRVSLEGAQQPPRGDIPQLKRAFLTTRAAMTRPPSLHSHYSRFLATTRQSAPLRRIGTFGLAVAATCAFPLASPVRFSRSVPKPGRASRCLHAGCHSVGIRTSSELIPEKVPAPGFDIV